MYKNKLLNKDDILNYFKIINDYLKQKNKNGEIIMCGGASLACIYNARKSTYDIDAIFEPTKDLREIISSIAIEYSLNDDWLNDGVKGFLNDKMTFSVYKKYSNLTVSSIDTEPLLALKITSARTNSKDMEDSIQLMKYLNIQSEDMIFEIVEKYIPKARQSVTSYYFGKEAYSKYLLEKKHEVLKKLANENVNSKKSFNEDRDIEI